MTLELVAALALLLAFLGYGLWAFQRMLVRHRAVWANPRPAGAGSPIAGAVAARPRVPPDGAWLAVRTSDAAPVLAALGITVPSASAWPVGLQEALQRGVVVLPPIDGWVLVAGADLVPPPGAEPTAVLALVATLSRRFGCAQWFLAMAREDQFGWAVAFAGELQRVYVGTAGALPWTEGVPTAAERKAGCFVSDPRDRSEDGEDWWPDLACVRQIAAAWSRDPWAVVPDLPAGAAAWLGRWRG